MNLSIPILYSLSVLLLLFSGYYFLGYRSQKKSGTKKSAAGFPRNKEKALSAYGATATINLEARKRSVASSKMRI